MSVVSVEARSFILALFIRDDGERFLLGDNGYDFIDSQLHFTANAIENDEVQKQGTDGVLVAGQVRRASVQTFDGYIGDATIPKAKIEQMRRDFFAFFAKGHHFRVIYVDCNRDAWQRKGGYLVDAPEVKELWQIHPEYHVGLNFEDVNYYEYDENAEGEEILANVLSVPISSEIEGGLEWDENGAISVLPYGDSKTATGKTISISDAVNAPLASFQLDGETSQTGTPTPDAPVPVQTVTGENVVKICGKNLLGLTSAANITSNGVSSVWDGSHLAFSGTATSNQVFLSQYIENNYPAGNYKLSLASPAASRIIFRFFDSNNSTLKSFTIEAGSSSVAVTLDGTEAKFRFVMLASSGETYNHSYDFQLELGSTATAYEPYQGQSYEVNLGKNLFDKDNANIFNGYLGTGGIVEAANARAIYIPVVAGQTYTFSRANSTSQVNDPYYAFIANEPVGGGQYLGGRHAVGQHDLTFTGTAPAGSKYLIFYFAWNPSAETLATILSTYQLELGSTATSYAAYFEPIELCKIGTYQDYIYKDGTDWKIHKATGKRTYTADDITIAASDTYSNVRYAQFPKGADNKQYGNYAYGDIINFFTHGKNMGATPAGGWNSYISDGLIYNSAMQDNYWCSFAKSTVLATMKEKLNGMVVYYALATPTDTEITNEALVAQLEAILSQGHTYAGTTNITTVIATGNEQGTLEVGYYSGYQDGGYVWEEGGSGGPTTVVNESISAVYPVWTVYGPAQNPILENTTNNTSIEYVGMVADGQTLVIDMGTQTASLDGLNVLSALTGDFIQLEAGSNILLYSASNDAPASEIGWSEIVG